MNTWQILHGAARERLRDLPDDSVQTCVTSPPYFGLRDYGVSGQIGLEATPEAFVSALVEVFQEVRRVLADDGTAWVNLGDSYNSGTQFNHHSAGLATGARYSEGERGDWPGHRRKIAELKTKDLIGIPWRVAFALQADGWYLRSDIIWSKPNPMPESVTDRPTKAHEYIFLLSKSARYYYDAAAIREPYAESTLREAETGYTGTATKEYKAANAQDPSETKRRVSESVRRRVGMVEAYAGKHAAADEQSAGRRMLLNVKAARDAGGAHENPFGKGANKRSVWHIATQPYPEAHFATFPEALIEPCILAGSRVGDTVLDPFNGSGTTGAVAIRHQRNYIGIELNADYIALARKRINAVAPLFAQEQSA